MQKIIDLMQLLSDRSRLRILMLLRGRELCVCQIMGVLGLSQPLVSRNLSLLQKAGFLDDRREGKMTFYAVKKSPGKIQDRLIGILSDSLRGNAVLSNDIKSLGECREFQKKTGKCGMETYLAYMEEKKKRGGRSKA